MFCATPSTLVQDSSNNNSKDKSLKLQNRVFTCNIKVINKLQTLPRSEQYELLSKTSRTPFVFMLSAYVTEIRGSIVILSDTTQSDLEVDCCSTSDFSISTGSHVIAVVKLNRSNVYGLYFRTDYNPLEKQLVEEGARRLQQQVL
ncbi:hypothetical protein P9112_000915 [Eukaryota sp. TZLM1-RC]